MYCKNQKNHFQSFRKHKRNYVTNDDIDMKYIYISQNELKDITLNSYTKINIVKIFFDPIFPEFYEKINFEPMINPSFWSILKLDSYN